MVELIDHVSEHSVLMPSKKHELKERKRKHDFNWYLGVFFILIVAIIWTFSSVLVQYIFHNLSFQGPFFLTYMGISLFSLNLPLYYLGQVVWPRIYTWYTNRKNVMKGYAFPTIPDFENEVKKKQKQKASYYEIAKISALISPLWFIANFTYNQSLNMTT
jgi:solute carrier family 35 protein F5